MDADQIFEFELSRYEWSSMTEIDGRASHIPVALRELMSSRCPEEADRAYWKLENHVVVQGQLFDSSIYVTHSIMAALLNYKMPIYVRRLILELLFQIVNGTTHRYHRERGFFDVELRCRAAARQGLWLLYLEYAVGESEAAKEIILAIEDDRDRATFLDN